VVATSSVRDRREDLEPALVDPIPRQDEAQQPGRDAQRGDQVGACVDRRLEELVDGDRAQRADQKEQAGEPADEQALGRSVTVGGGHARLVGRVAARLEPC
jgi:hypothetical protein